MTVETVFIESSWKEALKEEFQKPYFLDLIKFIKEERLSKNIFPPQDLVFAALNEVPFDAVKVIIVGQDPYHGLGQAHGLSFSVQQGIKPPPSLKNIFKEMVDDIGIVMPIHGCLLSLAKQGVLLLNSTLTVREKEPQSHYGMGWERFTNHVITKLIKRNDPLVFMLWGKAAQEKCANFLNEEEAKKHLVLKAAHPSPYSAYNGFFGCKHFSKANDFLKKHHKTIIDWQI
jgi:uracil-DNA glycosylase